MIIGRSSTKFMFFYADRKFKMADTAGHRLTLDPMGKCSNAFFSETTYMIKAKLYMNVHWMEIQGKCSNAFFSETTYMIKAKLYMNVHWMVLYKP